MATFSTSNFYSIERPENILNSSGTFTHFVCPIGFYGFWVHSDLRQNAGPGGLVLSGGLSHFFLGANSEDLGIGLFSFSGDIGQYNFSSQFSEISSIETGSVAGPGGGLFNSKMKRIFTKSLGNDIGGFRYLNSGDTLTINSVNIHFGASGWLRSTIFLYKNP